MGALLDVSIEKIDDQNNRRMKIQAQDWELNVYLSEQELSALDHIRFADWNMRQSIRAGVSANASVFWAYDKDNGMVSILVGHDDETWDIAVMLPLAELMPAITSARHQEG